MGILWQYLEQEKKGWKNILFFLFSWFLIIQVYMFFLINRTLGFDIKFVGLKVIFVIFCSAIIEEAAFRVMPFYLSYELFKKPKNYKRAVLISLIFISGFAFGIVHEFWQATYIKGLVGIFYGIIYLKLGGMNGRLIGPFCISCLFHIIHNIFVVSLFNNHFYIIFGEKIIPVL